MNKQSIENSSGNESTLWGLPWQSCGWDSTLPLLGWGMKILHAVWCGQKIIKILKKIILYEVGMMDICHYTFVPNHRMYSKVNYGLWVNPWFKKQCSALVEVFNNEGSCVCTGVGSIWEISGSSQFYCKPKTSLKAAHTPSKC